MQPSLNRITAALILAGIMCIPAHADPESGAPRDLMRSARLWDAKERPDLAKSILEKLQKLESSPDVLLMLGDLEARLGNAQRAGEYLQQLERQYPKHPHIRALRNLIAANTSGKETLTQARLAARAGNNDTAAQLLRRLYPDGAPPGEAGVEYHLVTGSTAKGFAAASSALASLYRSTGESRYRLAWLKLQGDRSVTPEVLQGFEALTRASDVHRPKLQDYWWQAIVRQAAGPAKQKWVGRYLKQFPDDRNAANYLAELQKLDEEAQRMASDPAVRARRAGLAWLEKGQLARAERELRLSLAKRPQDADVIGGIGLVRYRQERFDEAQDWFRRAAKADPDNKRWPGLIRSSRFGKEMKRVEQMIADGRMAEARKAAKDALKIDPSADSIAQIAGALAKSGDAAEAEIYYRNALKIEPGNRAALRGLLGLMIQSNRRDEAQALIAQFQQRNPKEAQSLNEDRARLMRYEAKDYLAAKHHSQAMLTLESALLLAPKDAWIRYDLASLYDELGLRPLSQKVMADGLAQAPNDDDMNYAAALLLTSHDREQDAIDRLARVPQSARTAGMKELETRARIKLLVRQAKAQQTGGNAAEAQRLMEQAEQHADSQPKAIEQAAEGWFGIDQRERGLALMRRYLDGDANAPLTTRLYYASLLNRARDDRTLAGLLPALQQRADWTDAQRDTLLEIETDLAVRKIEDLQTRGKFSRARALADQPAAFGKPDTAPTLKSRARLKLEAGQPKDALPLLQQALKKTPDDTEAKLLLARAYEQAGDARAATRTIDELLPKLPPNDIESRLSITRIEVRLRQFDRARAQIAELKQRFPNDPDILIQAGRIERSAAQYPAALNYFRQAQALEQRSAPAAQVPVLEANGKSVLPAGLVLKPALNIPPADATGATPTPASAPFKAALREPTTAEREIASIERRRDPRIETGFDYLSKSATDGMSSYRGHEIPVVAFWPIGYSGHAFVQTDRVSIDAKNLSPDKDTSYLFGQLAARQYRLTAPLSQTANGQSVAVGYQGDDLRWDIGLIGLGFPVQNVVGGVRKSWEVNKVDYAVELARRPVTSSLLAYAGTRDPATGKTWGGVTNTNISARAGTDFGPFYGYASAEFGLLRGENVLNNQRLMLRTGISRDFIRRPDMRLNLGLALSHWRYKENEDFFTYGHGGYYSPQQYTALALPFDWYGRRDKLTYLVRGSVSYSKSRHKQMPFYPTDASLQAMAAGNFAVGPQNYPAGYPTPFYPADNNGGGFGRALRLAAEYQLTPHLAIGGVIDIERSSYYAPNSFMLYLRYQFEPVYRPTHLRPVPVVPYSRF
ncbi:MAG: nrfG [Burkholderiaceae bacterium]|nr:nrfG [Burkholderiaceae bacterium]